MRFIAVVVVLAACARPRVPEAPVLPLDGDVTARESAYDQYRLTAEGDRVTRADGSYRAHMFVPLYLKSPRSHALIHRHDGKKIAAAVLSTIAAITTIVAIASL